MIQSYRSVLYSHSRFCLCLCFFFSLFISFSFFVVIVVTAMNTSENTQTFTYTKLARNTHNWILHSKFIIWSFILSSLTLFCHSSCSFSIYSFCLVRFGLCSTATMITNIKLSYFVWFKICYSVGLFFSVCLFFSSSLILLSKCTR